MQLYSYQEKCIESILTSPSPSQLISMPTGTGKTITFLNVAKRINKNTLIIVHRNELLDQTYEKAIKIGFKPEEISVINSKKKEKLSKLNISMIQSLNNILIEIDPNSIDVIIVDEAHHSLAQSYIRVFSYFNIHEQNKLLLGFTATPLRGDGKCLGSIYKDHVFKMTLQEATQKGYICPVHGLRIELKCNMENIDNQNGDYNIKELDKIVNCPEINNIIALKCSYLTRLPCIIFCSTVDHAENIKKILVEKGKKAEVISYLNSKAECEQILGRLKNGEIEFILNAVKLTEGFDHPPIQTIVIARPTRSPALYKQMIGRGLRLSPNKFDCLVIEFASNDPSMVTWEQIDTSATFQSFTEKEKIDFKEAKSLYVAKFLTNKKINVLNVRLSPFSFYECKVQRILKCHKNFTYIPCDSGFTVFKIIPFHTKKTIGAFDYYFRMFCYQMIWKDKYKSFYCHSYGELWKSSTGWSLNTLEQQIKFYASRADNGEPLGKWYPSEEEPMTPYQKKILPTEKTNARKAEMLIEEKFIAKAIKQFWIDKSFPELQENENGNVIQEHLFVIE